MDARRAIKRGMSAVVKAAAAGADVVGGPSVGLTLLVYHRVGARADSQIDLPLARFDEQVAELSAAGRLVSLDEGLARLDRGELADRPVVITFDDGTVDWIDEVLPVLVRHAAPATFYVATDFVERSRPWPDDGAPISWTGLRELVDSGLATIGSHTHTHALLDRADGPTAAAELDRSLGLLGERLGVTSDHFAYPKALLGTPEAEDEVRQRFRSAAIGGGRANGPGEDRHRLHRTPIQVSDGMRWFRRKADGGLRLEGTARSLLDQRRYAGATA